MMFKILVLFAFCILNQILAHPDRLVKKSIKWSDGDDLPEILSYHIHCLFGNSDSNRIKAAMLLYYNFSNHFNLTSSPLCKNLFDEKRLCMFGI